jgi:hypothetical protein
MWKKILNNVKHWLNVVKHWLKKQDKNTILAGAVVIGVIVIAGAIYLGANLKTFDFSNLKFWEFGDKKIAEDAVDYINDNGLATSEVSLVSVSNESGLIKIKIKFNGNEFDSYISKDGKYLFPQVIEMKKSDKNVAEGNTDNTSSKTCDTLTKTAQPTLEAYVVSRCPYGLQMQRMIADALKEVPALADYIKVKYIGGISGNTITSMHGEAEATENLRQICIREEQPAKYWSYVGCQMKSGDTAECEKSTGVDSAKLSACMSSSARGVAYAKEDFDLANNYKVSGSPTLILDGATVEEFDSNNKPIFGSSRSSDELKTIICCASENQPSFCSQTLNTASAASSFSEDYEGSGSTTSADCQ